MRPAPSATQMNLVPFWAPLATGVARTRDSTRRQSTRPTTQPRVSSPRVERIGSIMASALPSTPGGVTTLRLRRSLLLEVVISVVILAVTALLVNAAPARELDTGPYLATLNTKQISFDVTIIRLGQPGRTPPGWPGVFGHSSLTSATVSLSLSSSGQPSSSSKPSRSSA